MTAPALSIVMATHNRAWLLRRTFPTLLSQHCSEVLEIVVAADGCTDGTAALLRELGSHRTVTVTIVELRHVGQVAALNAAAGMARGDRLLFMDDDMLCSPALAAAHLAAHQIAGDRVLVVGPLLLDASGQAGLARAWIAEQTDAHYRAKAAPGWIDDVRDCAVGPNSSMHREIFERSGGFDERLPAAFDCELAVRLAGQGIRFWYAPAAQVWQVWSKSTARVLLGDAPAWGAGELLLCRRHPEMRSTSMLAAVGLGLPVHLLLRRLLVAGPQWLFRATVKLVELAEGGMRGRRASRLGLALFRQLHALAMLRGAARACGSYRRLARDFGRRLPVLMYHHLGDSLAGADPTLTVAPRAFASQLRLLRRLGRTTIAPQDWEMWLASGQPLPKHPVLLTFDDGYADVEQIALPILRRHQATGHAFVVSGHVGGHNSWDEPAGWRTRPLMNIAQLRRWRAAGQTVGSHSRTHPRLTSLSPAEQVQELAGSKAELEAIAGAASETFAYPHGDWDEAVKNRALSYYRMVFSSEEGLNTLRTDRGLLRRTMVYPTDGALRFASRVLFGRDILRDAWVWLYGQSIQVRRRVANSQRSPWRTMRSS
ncbi:MAG: polysaccharide deacetylase family protein [Chloroflexi bacterium]|nr:polysaccharide deacetylase family protein [Chloroflexota bacterium]